MTAPTPGPPLTIVPKGHYEWTVAYSDYPSADGWGLLYTFTCRTKSTAVTIPGSGMADATVTDAGGGSWTVVLPSTADGTQIFDSYVEEWYWQEYVEKTADNTERAYLRAGTFTVLRNLDSSAITAGYDHRSHAKKMLDALLALAEGKATKDQQAYSIQGRSLSRLSPEQVIKWIRFYETEVERERQAQRIARGLGNPNVVKVRLSQ